jgi:hypothetical protein
MPERDWRYLAWIRTLPCVVCGGRAEAHHTGPHGRGVKASDYTAIPLCTEHHTGGQYAYHKLGRVRFESTFVVCVATLVEKFNRWYRLKRVS